MSDPESKSEPTVVSSSHVHEKSTSEGQEVKLHVQENGASPKASATKENETTTETKNSDNKQNDTKADAPPRYAIAKAAHTAAEADVEDLHFEIGARIRILFHEGEGWWEGELNGKTGMFPSEKVDVIPHENEMAAVLVTGDNSSEPVLRIDGLGSDVHLPELYTFLQTYGTIQNCSAEAGAVVVQYVNSQGTANVLQNRLKFKGRDILLSALPPRVASAYGTNHLAPGHSLQGNAWITTATPLASSPPNLLKSDTVTPAAKANLTGTGVKRPAVVAPASEVVKKPHWGEPAQGEPKLFVQRVDVGQDAFKKALEVHGEVIECAVMSSGYGFATYANAAGTQTALAAGFIEINGQKVGISMSKSSPSPNRFASPVGAMSRHGGMTFAQQQAYAQQQQTFAQQQAYAQQQQIYAQQQAYAQQQQQQAYAQQQQEQQQPYNQQQPQYAYTQQASATESGQDYSAQTQQTLQQPGQYTMQQQEYTQQYTTQQQQQQYAQQYAAYQAQAQTPAASQSWADPVQSSSTAVQPTIYVSGLPLTLTNHDFLSYFQQFGQIANTNFQTGTPVVAIIFSNADSTRLFCSMHDRLEIQGSKLSIQLADTQTQQTTQQSAYVSQASPYQQVAYSNTPSQAYPTAQSQAGTVAAGQNQYPGYQYYGTAYSTGAPS